MFRFANPEYLHVLYVIPVIILLYWLYRRNRAKLLEHFSEKKLHNVLFPSFSGFKNTIKFSIIIISLIFLIIAAANPQVGTKMEEVKEVASHRLKMPPKSTFFYPKLLSGLVINPL